MTVEQAKKLLGIREDQIWLLKAALFTAAEALPFWNLWKLHWQLESIPKEAINYSIFVNVDDESRRILPLVYRNLEQTQDSLLPALREAYRNTWMRNQQLLHRAQQVVNSCNEAGIPTMLLKGIPMSLHYYKDMGVRPMGDVDVLVPWQKVEDAILVLKKFGNQPDPVEYKYRHLIHAMHCFDEGGVDVDLHWQAFFFQQHTEKCVLEKRDFRQPITLAEDNHSFILSDSYQLFHTIIHGTIGGQPTIRWVPDAYIILKKSDSINLNAIFEYGERYNVQFALHTGLQFLIEHFRFEFICPTPLKNTYIQDLFFNLFFRNERNILLKRVFNFIKSICVYFLFVKPQNHEISLGYWIYRKIGFSLANTKRHNTTTFFER